jgi:hypothetical protein
MLGVAGVIGVTFRLDDVAGMLGETPGSLAPGLAEAIAEELVLAGEDTVSFLHGLMPHAAAGLIPAPARRALHGQYAVLRLNRGGAAAAAAAHLLKAAQPGDPVFLAGLDQAAARMARSSPKTAADLALRALDCTPPADPARPGRALAAAEALAAAGRPEPAAQLARDLLARPLPALAEARIRCVLSSALCANGLAQDARAQAGQALAATAELPAEVRDLALSAELQALAALADDEAVGTLAASVLVSPRRNGSHVAAAAPLAAHAYAAVAHSVLGAD